MNLHSYPPPVTSPAGTARSLSVNPGVEGSARRAPCALSPGAPPHTRAQAESPWHGWETGPPGEGEW